MATRSTPAAWESWRRELAHWQRSADAWLAELEAKRAALGARA
jgi:hypothetical protein